MPNLSNSEIDGDLNLPETRKEQMKWLMDFFNQKMQEDSGKVVEKRGDTWKGQMDLANWIYQKAGRWGNSSAIRSMVQQGLRLKKDDEDNYRGTRLSDENAMAFGLAYQALMDGAWDKIPSRQLGMAIEQCLSKTRDWDTGEVIIPDEETVQDLCDLHAEIGRAVPMLESLLVQAGSLQTTIKNLILDLGQNTEKEGANPPENIPDSRIPIMSKNMAQFAVAMQRAIDASGRPMETVRRGCVGRSRLKGDRFDRALAGDESLELSPGDVLDLHVCVAADAWEYSLEELRELAGCGDCGDRVSH